MKTSTITDGATNVAGTVTDALGDAWHVSADRLSDLASVAVDRAGELGHVVSEHLPDADEVRKAGRRAARQGRRTAQQTAKTVRRELPRRKVPTVAIAAMIATLVGVALWWRSRRRHDDASSVTGWSTATPTSPQETAALVGG